MKLRFLLPFVMLALTAFSAMAQVKPGMTAPNFTLSDSDGHQVNLSNYRGKYVVLEVLLVTCPHCQAASKVLEKMQMEFPKQLQVLGISTPGYGVIALTDYKRVFGVTYPLLQGDWNVIGQYLGVTPARPDYRIPWFFVISPSGQVLDLKNPDVDKSFYANPNPAGNAADTGDAWLMKNLEAMVRQYVQPKKAEPARKRPAAKRAPAAKKTPK